MRLAVLAQPLPMRALVPQAVAGILDSLLPLCSRRPANFHGKSPSQNNDNRHGEPIRECFSDQGAVNWIGLRDERRARQRSSKVRDARAG